MHLEGFVDSDAGLCPVVTQPDVHATRGAVRAEVEPWMIGRGYHRRSTGENYESRHVLVEDLHDGNVLIDADGNVQVIDAVLFGR